MSDQNTPEVSLHVPNTAEGVDVRVDVYDGGETVSPWGGETVYAYNMRVLLTVDGDDASAYECTAYGSIHDYRNGDRDPFTMPAVVLDELMSFHADPDEFAYLLSEGVTDGASFVRLANVYADLLAAEPIAEAVYAAFGDSPDPVEALENWAASESRKRRCSWCSGVIYYGLHCSNDCADKTAAKYAVN